MASEKQIAANRRNASKSTGPRTIGGKGASSRNAVKHGILSEWVVAANESQDQFDAFLSQLLLDHNPVGATEFALVERLAIQFWRERRLAQSERWALEEPNHFLELYEEADRQRAIDTKCLNLNTQLLIGRYQTMLSNQVAQTLRELRAEQERRMCVIEG